MAAAKAAGLDVGGYWRFFPRDNLNRQVNAFSARLLAAQTELPPMVDIEDADGLTRAELTVWARNALMAVFGSVGVIPLLYTNRSFLRVNLDASLLTRWPLALALWNNDPAWPAEQPTFWQYAGATTDPRTTVPWAAGRIDRQRRRI